MIRKSTLLAIVASAALGLAMLAPTSASAMRGGGGGGHGHGGGMHSHGGGHGGHGGGMHRRHGGGHHVGHRHRHRHWHVRHHRPVWYGVRTVGYTGYTVARPVAGPCTCLSKEYTSEGAVLFKDRCTNEAAMNPPVIAPQRTGLIDAPTQQAENSPLYQATPDNALPQVDPTTGLPK